MYCFIDFMIGFLFFLKNLIFVNFLLVFNEEVFDKDEWRIVCFFLLIIKV